MSVMSQDGILHISLLEGQARAILTESTQVVQRAKDIHGLSRIATAALGRTLTATAMMGSMLKGRDESVTTSIKGGGPIGTVLAVAGADCSVKGYVDNPAIDLPRTGPKLPVGAAVGREGRLSVIKDLRMREPYVGQVNLVSGEIAEDFAMYFTASEQTPSLVSLGVLVSDRDHIVAAAGLPRRDVLEKRISAHLEEIMESRRTHIAHAGDAARIQPVDGVARYAGVAAPIIAAGDVSGSVCLMMPENGSVPGDGEHKLTQVAAAFLGRQLEG